MDIPIEPLVLNHHRISTPSPPPLPPRRCFIQNIETKHTVYLPNKSSFTLGRRRELQITDTHLSRKQLQCYIDADHFYFSIKQIGRSLSGINGDAILDDRDYEISNKDILDLRLNVHRFVVHFEPQLSDAKSKNNNKDENSRENEEIKVVSIAQKGYEYFKTKKFNGSKFKENIVLDIEEYQKCSQGTELSCDHTDIELTDL